MPSGNKRRGRTSFAKQLNNRSKDLSDTTKELLSCKTDKNNDITNIIDDQDENMDDHDDDSPLEIIHSPTITKKRSRTITSPAADTPNSVNTELVNFESSPESELSTNKKPKSIFT
jgi:hypothetical protein